MPAIKTQLGPLALATLALLSGNARAQESEVPAAPAEPAASANPSDAALETLKKFQRFDALAEHDLSVKLPPTIDSLWRDVGGWRSALAEHDISLTGRTSISLAYDVLENNRPARPQVYNGQKYTVTTVTQDFILGIGLGRVGLPNSQFLFGGQINHSSWLPTGPDIARVKTLAYYQSFRDGAIQLKAGWIPNYREYIGIFAGGNPFLANGLSGIVPVQVGLSADPATTPAVNVSITSKNGTYFKGGIQRSTSPLGQLYEVKHNGFGLNFGSRRASALYIGEVGKRQAPAPDKREIWVRAGAIYNTSDYSSFKDSSFRSNTGAYALGDYQVSQISRSEPYRGLFIGASAMYADPKVNVSSKYYELRTYALGLFNARPSDAILFSVAYTGYSNDAHRYLIPSGVKSPRGQVQVTTSYTFHVIPGVYLTSSLTYLDHPAFGGDYRDGLVAALTLFVSH
ncbi:MULTISPECIES: carbohydrate porin [unclassified Stenotrophomonas]|uniref:carbohydrate porin n=2 Tax=Bacteria TaxID=2 RepID=UPI0015E679E3|nr:MULTISPECIES: carbohydrate porin [unclassified Stenotrophomonas]